MPLTQENVLQYRGGNLVDSTGDKVGRIEEIYLDTETDQPEWALVNTGLFGSKSTFVPIQNAQEDGGSLRVPFEKARIKDAPSMDANQELSQQDEAELYQYYGMSYGENRSDSGLPEGGAPAPTQNVQSTGTTADVSGDKAMTRSEEELRVGVARRETGRVRLRKFITTEQVSTTVPVHREEVHIEREAITDANVGDATSGVELTESVHEVTLSEETPVVEKRVVPKERIRLDKDVVEEQVQVNETVRKEQVEIDDGTRGTTDPGLPGPGR